MENCLGIIRSVDSVNNFGELCKKRAVHMLPFAGRYRLIDFALSNMVNHGIRRISLYTGEKIGPTLGHIGDGEPWELNRRLNGLSIFPPRFEGNKTCKSDIFQFHFSEDYYKNVKEEYIFIMQPNVLANIDLNLPFEYFIKSNADITAFYTKEENEGERHINRAKLILDDNRELRKIGVNLGMDMNFNKFLHMGFIKKEVFLNIIRQAMETGEEYYFEKYLIKTFKNYKVNAYEVTNYVEEIRDINSYYRANMNLLNERNFEELFYKHGTIFTKSNDEPPTFYSEESKIKNSLIANGCSIEGIVENSIVFRGAKVGKNAIVKDSILMEKSYIKEGARIENSIIDKGGILEEGMRIVGARSNPYVIGKRITIGKE